MRRRSVRVLVLLTFLTGSVACGDDETPTEPTQPTRPTTTETFSGTLTVNGAVTHPFTATGSGQMTLRLTTLSPDSAARVGLSLGTFTGTTCQIVLANDNASQGAIVVGNAGAAGNFCARVYDVGQLGAPTEYTITVEHF
jgi:hypothetical protein